MNIFHLSINPIDYERRIKNQAESSSKSGNSVWIVALGKYGEDDEEVGNHYYLKRITTPFFKGGPLKFIHYNLKSVFFLFSKEIDILHCHDLWTMPAAYVLNIVKKFSLVYDAHEYVAGLEIFIKNKFKKKLWMLIEKVVIKKVNVLITVSEPIAQLYRKKYPNLNKIEVIRNLPGKKLIPPNSDLRRLSKTGDKIILYQGHFRPGRGLMQLIEAMSYINEAHLVMIGGGELEEGIRQKIKILKIDEKISLIGYLPTDQLIPTASGADLDVVLFEPTSINYTYALPNKFFEYIMAGIPILASNLVTFEEYINKYKIGMAVDPHSIKAIAEAIKMMLSDDRQLTQWRENAVQASETLNWENESQFLKKIYEQI